MTTTRNVYGGDMALWTQHMGPDGKCRSVEVKTSYGILNRPVQRLYPMELHVPDEPVAARDTSSPSESVTAMTPATAAEVESTNVSRFESTVLSNADPTWECVGNNGQTRRGRQTRLPARFQTI